MMKTAEKTKKAAGQRKPVKLAIILFIVVLLVGGLGFAGYQAYEYYNGATVLVRNAEDLKKEIKALATHVQKGNYEAANLSVQKIDNLSAEMRATLADERWKLAQEKAPKYGDDLKTAVKFLDVVDEASDTLFKPGVKYLREKGLPSKATFSKITPELGNTLNEYADLIDELCPAIEKVLNDFNALPVFEYEKLEAKVSKYRTLAKENDPEIRIYLKFLKETSDSFIRPTAKYLVENGSALKLEFSMDKIGPEMASQITVLADGIDTLSPLAEKAMNDFIALPAVKIEKVEAKLSKYRKLAKDNEADITSLMKFARELSSNVMRPAATVMNRSPFSNLKTEKGDIDTKIIRDYLNLVETVKPYINRVTEVLKTNKLLKDHPKQTAKISSKLDTAMELLDEYNTYVPLIDVVLGDGSDKRFLIVAQNSAEMRSSGGLPSALGLVTIEDGIMHIGDFEPVFSYLSKFPKKYASYCNFTNAEKKLILDIWPGYGKKSTGATVNPHFPRAAQLIAKCYKKEQKKDLDGVISMTPAIVGRLIGVTGTLKLSNGVKLDEKYAVKYLQHDIYYQYFNKKALSDKKLYKAADKTTNELFAEAAKKVISSVMSDLNLKNMRKILEVIKKSGEDRVFMMWMANKDSEEVIKKLGLSGSLNYDKDQPEIGVFFNNKDPNKLGIHVDIKVTYGKAKTNKDGSVTYPVTVKLKNAIDNESLKKGAKSAYLTSTRGGDMRPFMLFSAPAGGKITNFKCSRKEVKAKSVTYEDLKFYRCSVFILKAKNTITFTYNVTTAPGVNVKPKIVTTPLLSAYRNAKAPK
ncbi:MAG: DUF4012 domain-containing protein [Clostridiales bacterium]|nr:DUF4012 domain-containing protein [Clostridiales bacterium]